MIKDKFFKLIFGLTIACVLCGCGPQKSYQAEVDLSEAITDDDSESKSEEETSVLESAEEEVEKAEPEVATSEINIEENCEKLIEYIRFWEYECLYWSYDTVNEKSIDFTVDEAEKAKLAVLTTPLDAEITAEEARIYLWGPDIQENAQNIFGSGVIIDSLPERTTFVERQGSGKDARAILLLSNAEDECIYQVISQEVMENGDGYDVVQNLYCGYWGGYVENQGNYQVTFHLKKDENSFYGIVLKEMSFIKTESNAFEVSAYEPFYGIWCCGVKNEEDANSVADKLLSNGYDAQVLISSDWSNLNPDKWYVVTTGFYPSEAEAKAALDGVKSVGYSDAYVKYSGEYIGN